MNPQKFWSKPLLYSSRRKQNSTRSQGATMVGWATVSRRLADDRRHPLAGDCCWLGCNACRTVDRSPIVHCFVLFFYSFLLLFASLTWSILLPTKVNKASKNPGGYIIVRAKITWKRHVKYDKLVPNKYRQTYLLLVLEQNKRKTNLRT